MEIHIYSINVLPFILVNLVFTSTKTDASCFLPEDLTNAAWEYNYTDVADSSEQSTTLNIATTTLQNSVINLNAFGTTMRDWTCINSLNISNTQTLVVFKSDNSFSNGPFGGSQWLYLCMKLTKVTNVLYYFHLLSDIETSVFPNERVFMSEAGNAPADEAPMCRTFCQYTDSLNIRTLRRPGTNDVLPNNAALCEPCGSDCNVESTEFSGTTPKRTTPSELTRTTIMTTESTLESVNTPISSSTYFTESTKFKRTAPTRTTPLDASCFLPEDLTNAAWEYNYTDVSDSSEQSTTLNIATTTLHNSVINLNAFGTTIRDWTCINSLNISNTQTLVVFKSDTSFVSGPLSGNRRLYLCMKFTKVTNDLYYFHLLSDIETSVFPNERVFISEAGNPPADEAPMCSTFCQYTDSLNIRTLRRPGTKDVLPNGAALCEPCGSDCTAESTEFSGTASKRTTPAELYRTIMTTGSTLESVKTPMSSSTYFTDSTAPTRTTPLDASCFLPEDLTNAAWEYNYTDVSDSSEQSTTLNIGTTTLHNSVINLNAFGTTMRDWTCINSLNISNTQTLVVFKSDTSFASGPFSGNRRLYLCMKITKVTNDLFYFHLLSDIETSVFPNERVFMSEAGNAPADEAPMCSTFCQYTGSLNIRTLRRPGTNDVLPNDAALCEPCGSDCIAELYRTTVMTTESTLESVKTPISSSTYFTESTKFDSTAPTRTTPLDARCFLPKDLTNAAWEYNYTDVADNSQQSTTLNIATTTLHNSVINLNAFGTTMRDWTCINSLNISNTQTLVVFKSDTSFTSGPTSGNRWLYLCMKFTKVTNDLYYFHLLSDIETSVFPNERVFMSEAGNAPTDEAPMCSTFCQYTDSLKIRTLRRPGTNDVLPNDAALCEPCDSACVVESTEFSDTAPKRTISAELYRTTIMTTESTLESVKTPISSSTYFTEYTKFERTAPTRTTPLDANCVLPEDLKNAVWEYNYTDVASNSEQSTTLNIGTTTLQNSVINLNVFGTTIRDWTCINSLNISNAQTLVVFKSDTSFTSGLSSGNRRLYLCMKFTKVTNDLYYFHLLSDIETSIFPNERVFMSEAGNPPSDEAPMCSTFCQYTDSLKIRTLRRPGTNDVLPNGAALCEPCGSACVVESTEFSDTAPKRTTSAELDITTIMTTESTLESVTTPTSSFTYFTESTAPTGTTPLDSIHHCADNLDRFDTKWNRTVENTLVTVTCTGEYTGTVSRNCSSGGMWNEPDYTQCISKSIKNIKTQLDKLLAEDSEFPLVSTILGNLENVTSANDELRTGDLVTASALLEDIAKYVTNHTDKISVDQLENFGSICNDLLDKKYHQSWEEQKDKGTSGITTVVKAVTDYNSVFHNVLDGEFSMLVNKENIVIEVGKTSSAEIIVPDRLQTNDSWIVDSGTEMKLKKNSCSDLTGYSCTFYRNISSLFPKQILLNREVQPFDGIYDVNSIIADVSIEAESCSDYSLDLRFGHVLGNHSRPVCGFWEFNVSNTVNGAWSSFGSLVVESTDSYTICEYNHTTNFAILMSPERTPSPDNFPLSLISAIGCAISILFLFITIVVHLVLWRYVRTDRSKTLMNLCVAFILSYVIFLAGITRTENKAVCTAIAVALHYMFLTDFALMLAEGILIVRMVIIVFPTKSIVHWLLPACWVVPGIIVGISAGVTKLNGYGNEQFCWLTLDSNLIWAFIGPALIVILINFVIIVLTVHKMMTSKGLARKTLEEKSRIGIESICVILPLFGITWVLGAFSVNEDLVMFQYLFAIFNSLQGLFICLFHCFFNKQVKQGYYHFQRRRKANWSNIVVSTDTSNYYTHTRQQRNSNSIFTQSKEQENGTTYRYASQSLYGN